MVKNPAARAQILLAPFISNLGKLVNLSEFQYPHLKNGA